MQKLWNKFETTFSKIKIGTLEVRYKMEISNYMVKKKKKKSL